MLSETDLQFVTQSLYADIPPRVLHKMISFNFQVSELHFSVTCMYLKLLVYKHTLQVEVLIRRECGTSLWEFNLRDILRWCQLMKDYQVL